MTKHHWHSPESRPEKPGYYFRYYGNKEADSQPDYWDGVEWLVDNGLGQAMTPSGWPRRWREQ